MKKLVVVSNESIFSGVVRCGIAEMVDSLANTMSTIYDTYIVCPDGNGIYARGGGRLRDIEEGVRACRFSNVNYYLIKPSMWSDKVAKIIDALRPDILHNIAEPEIITRLLNRPNKAICTFDSMRFVQGKERYLLEYDSVTTHSETYAKLVMESGTELSKTLSHVDFRGVNNGVLDGVVTPTKGLFLASRYSSTDLVGKAACKEKLKQMYGIQGDPYICLVMCRLVKDKNIDAVIESIPVIKETGGTLLIVGKGDREYEHQLQSFRRSDGVVYVNRWASPIQAAPLTGGADFFLQPSTMETGGLMPLTASIYGAIPIVTLNGGLADNFTHKNAIVVGDQGVNDAIRRAAELYADKDALAAMRKVCMEQNFFWSTRKQGYIDLYEKI